MWSALFPLVPEYSDRFALSTAAAGVLLASSSLASLAVSLPAAALADRVGTAAVTVAAMALVATAGLAHAVAWDLWSLLLARIALGVAYGALWTAGVAWLDDVAGGEAPRALSFAITVSALGAVSGPALAAAVAGTLGLAAPFAIAGAVAGVVTVGLALRARGPRGVVEERAGTLASSRTAVRQVGVAAGLVLVLLGGLVSGVANLLVPLELARNGVSTTGMGVLFALSSLAFLLTSVLVVRLGARATRLGVGAAACLAIAVVAVLPIASTATLPLAVFLLLRAPASSTMFSVAFPLALSGGRAAAVSTNAVSALLNVAWAMSAFAGPLLAGALADAASPRATYLALLLTALVAGGWMATRRPLHARS